MIVVQLILFCMIFTLMVAYSVRGGAINALTLIQPSLKFLKGNLSFFTHFTFLTGSFAPFGKFFFGNINSTFSGVHPAVCFCIRLMDFVIFMFFCKGEFVKELFQEYVDGKCELGETFEKVEKSAKEYFDEKEKMEEADREKKNETKTSKILIKFSKTLFEMKMFENFNEKKLEEIKTEVDVL